MLRYVAFLRGVSPMNARMADLRECFGRLGFTDVRTVRSSGNVVFTAGERSDAELAAGIEAGMARHLPRSFATIVRSQEHLASLLATDPYAGFDVPPDAKRVVTFLGDVPDTLPPLPIEREGARLVAVTGGEAFTYYVRSARGPEFMALIEGTFGRNVTTRTWDTIRLCAAA